jgi:hypothetical protein
MKSMYSLHVYISYRVGAMARCIYASPVPRPQCGTYLATHSNEQCANTSYGTFTFTIKILEDHKCI